MVGRRPRFLPRCVSKAAMLQLPRTLLCSHLTIARTRVLRRFSPLSYQDLVVLIAYFALHASVAVWSALRSRRARATDVQSSRAAGNDTAGAARGGSGAGFSAITGGIGDKRSGEQGDGGGGPVGESGDAHSTGEARRRDADSSAAATPSAGAGSESESYFLAGRDTGWMAVGCSFFASNIGSDTLVGLSGNGARYGLTVSLFDWASPIFFVLLGWVFSPLYTRAGVSTTPEWIERRYSAAARVYLSVLSLIMYVLTKLSLSLIAGGVVLRVLLGWDLWLSMGLLLVVTGAYVVAGGMHAVIATEVVQTGVLLVGCAVLATRALGAVGGLGGLADDLAARGEASYLHLFPDLTATDNAASSPYPVAGMLLGYPFLAFWFHVTDQEMVQRGLSAKSDVDAKAGCVSAGFLKFLVPLGFVIPGICARVLYGAELEAGESGYDAAFPLLVAKLMPSGLLGLMVAAMLAALMSTLASTFNSSSTLFTMDIYVRLRPRASDKEQVFVGRCVAVAMVLLALAWVPMIYNVGSTLYLAVQSVIAHAAPPIAAIFLLGAFVPRVNSRGALSGLAVGHLAGAGRLAFVLTEGDAESTGFVHDWTHFNFLEYAAVLGVLTAAVALVVSFACPSTTAGAAGQTGTTWVELSSQARGPDATRAGSGFARLAGDGADSAAANHDDVEVVAPAEDAAAELLRTGGAEPQKSTAEGGSRCACEASACPRAIDACAVLLIVSVVVLFVAAA